MAIKKFLENEELVKRIATDSSASFETFVSQRDEIDEKNRIADYMYAAAQNRALMSSEKSKGMNLDKDTRANVGSPLFHRQVNVLAGLLVRVLQSDRDLFRYVPTYNYTVDGSYDESEDEAEQLNVLARWTRKKDGWDSKLPEFSTSLFKYSIGFITVGMKREKGKVTRKIPVPKLIGNSPEGLPIYEVQEKEDTFTGLKNNHPTFSFLHPDRVYLDRYCPDVQTQNTVIILSLRSRSQIYGDVLAGIFDADKFADITSDMKWDGNYGSELKKEEAANRNEDYQPSAGLYLQWDVYSRVPVSDSGEYDEEQPDRLIWSTYVGNSLTGAICLRCEETSDPDGEIPLQAIRVIPDRPDELYHTTISEIVRSAYSADCTLLNLALDNMGLVNDPPLTVIDGAHRIRDFTFKKGQKWHVDRHDAIKAFEVRDNTQSTVILRRSIQDEIKQALNTDAAFMGEYAGSRTSASEFLGVNQNSQITQLIWIKYITHQMLPWMARKIKSYWQEFGGREQVIRITDAEKVYDIKPKEIAGDFDIMVDIVDQYEDDQIKQQQASLIIQTIGANQYLQQSPTHTIDAGELTREWLNHMGWKSDKIIRPPMGVDAEMVARNEIFQMLTAGQYVQPQPGQDFDTHLRVEEAERLRWKGLEGSGDARIANLALLDQHIAAEKQMMQQQAQVQNAQQSIQTPGQLQGNQAAAIIGGQLGGMNAG